MRQVKNKIKNTYKYLILPEKGTPERNVILAGWKRWCRRNYFYL
jgi:hypothetical protein